MPETDWDKLAEGAEIVVDNRMTDDDVQFAIDPADTRMAAVVICNRRTLRRMIDRERRERDG